MLRKKVSHYVGDVGLEDGLNNRCIGNCVAAVKLFTVVIVCYIIGIYHGSVIVKNLVKIYLSCWSYLSYKLGDSCFSGKYVSSDYSVIPFYDTISMIVISNIFIHHKAAFFAFPPFDCDARQQPEVGSVTNVMDQNSKSRRS